MKKTLALLICTALILSFCTSAFQEVAYAEEISEQDKEVQPEISAPSAVLMEASTGAVLYEKDANTPRPPASVTKVMSILTVQLIF